MSHMPAIAQPAGVATVPVVYVATGIEGADLTIPIPRPMFDTAYSIVFSSGGGTSGDDSKQSSGVEVVDMPTASRTTTTFRVVLGQQPAAGDVLNFLLFGTVA